MSDLECSVNQTLEAYAAVLARDIDAFMNLHDPGTRVFDTWGVWPQVGADARSEAIFHREQMR